MKSILRILVPLVVCVVFIGFFVPGCKRPPAQGVNPNANNSKGKDDRKDPFFLAHETFRTPENGIAIDDITRFRDGLQTLNNHFTTPDVAKQTRLDTDERSFLEKDAHLTEAEFLEIESSAFRNGDAHYLDECTLLRDAAQKLEISGVSPIDQAHFQFRWVMRNVLLHEQGDDWIPPAFTLRRGYGGPLERALVFLALLRQSRLEGCLITAPDADGPPFLVAVMEPRTSSLRLFDPRLGLAVLTNDGKRIATLKEAQDDPSLLQPSGITPEQAKKLEARLVCPLFALAPRMRILEDGLSGHELITLHLKAPALVQEFAKAAQLPVKVWNPPLEGKNLPNSPTRCLWMFLPRQEGGVDDGQRATAYTRARLPFASVTLNFALVNVNSEQMNSRHAWSRLLIYTSDLLNKYDLQPREMYLRGLRDQMVGRQNRLEPFVKADIVFAADEIPKWLDEVRSAYASFDANDPKDRGKGQQAVNALWGKDLFLGRLIQVDKDEQFERKDKNLVLETKTVLTKILAVGTREHFDFEIRRSQAAANHEVAERAEAMKHAKAAEEGWVEAKSAANRYLGRIALQAKVDQGRFKIHQRLPDVPGALDAKIGLLEDLHLEVQRYFAARLRLAECLVHTDPNGAKAAAEYLEASKREIEALERNALLKSDIDKLGQMLPQIPAPARAKYQKRLDLLANDWSERGNYYWMKQQIDRRVATSSGPPTK